MKTEVKGVAASTYDEKTVGLESNSKKCILMSRICQNIDQFLISDACQKHGFSLQISVKLGIPGVPKKYTDFIDLTD